MTARRNALDYVDDILDALDKIGTFTPACVTN
jgi:hypothetical protein